MALAALSCTPKSAKQDVSSDSSTPQNWNSKMVEISHQLSVMGPYIFDERQFSDPANFETIRKQTKKLYELSQSIDPKHAEKFETPSSDPAIPYFATQFREDIQRAHESLESDHRTYARSVLRTSMSYCISCHTRSDAGPKFTEYMSDAFVLKLQPMERARYYTATRQYESALKQFIAILEDPNTGKNRPFDIERAARSALAIAVRVYKDPEQATKIVKDVIDKPVTPLFVRNDATAWLKSIQAWKKDKNTILATEAGMLSKVKGLIAQAEAQQRYPADMKGDIYYLRATSLIHDYFNKYSKPKYATEMYYYAGASYDALKELGFWTLHEMYYEKCVRETPHSAMARKCYESLEQSVLLGYSGSAGLFLPATVQKQLNELRALAIQE